MSLLRLSILAGMGLICLLALGCEREDPIATYQAPKEPPHIHRDRIEWKAPANWVEWPGDERPIAGFTILAGFTLDDNDPPLELTVSYLERGEAPEAGSLRANVNRWERQLKMPPSPPEQVKQLARKIVVSDRNGYQVDLLGPAGDEQKRTLAAMISEGDRVWFVKVMGEASRVEKRKSEFDQLLSSLILRGPKKESKGELLWNTPEDWINAGERPMRFLTFLAGDDADPAEVMITRLGGTGFGEVLENINRWRAQVGLPAVTRVEDQPSEHTKLAGNDAAYFDFTGPGTAEKPNRRMLLLMSVAKGDVWFFKMIGPQQVVESQKPSFDEFLKSVEFQKGEK